MTSRRDREQGSAMDLGNRGLRRKLFAFALVTALGQPAISQTEDRFIRQPKRASVQTPAEPIADIPRAEKVSLSLALPQSAADSPANKPELVSVNSPASPSSSSSSSSFQSASLVRSSAQADSAFRWRPRGSQANPPSSQTTSRMPEARDSFQLSGFRSPMRTDPASLQLRPPAVESREQSVLNSGRASLALPDTTQPASSPTETEMATEAPKPTDTVSSTRRIDYEKIASGISQELMDQHHAQRPTGQHAVSSLESPPGWQAVGARMSEHMRKCEQLIARKANLSAIAEAETGIHFLLRVLDLHSNQYQSEPIWSEAQRAFHEAEDFRNVQRLAGDQHMLTRIVESHETRILKAADVSHLSPLAAAQRYHRFAQNRLVLASQGHPWASELYYVLGRALQAHADEGGEDADALREKALTFYRASREILPTNSIASNQLGYLLLGMDQPVEAREALIASVQSGGPAAAWQNLVEANRRLGDVAGQNWATQNYFALQRQMPPQAAMPAYVELDPRQFASLSPREGGPKPTPGPPATSMPVSVQPGRPVGYNHDGYTANGNRYNPSLR